MPVAAGTNSMMRYLGSIVGAGLLAGILSTGAADDGAVPEIGVFRAVFIVVAVMAGLAIIVAFWIHRFPPEEAVEVSAESGVQSAYFGPAPQTLHPGGGPPGPAASSAASPTTSPEG